MTHTPYTTSAGVQIGVRYQPKPPQPNADAETIQAALLEPVRKPTTLRRIVAALRRLADSYQRIEQRQRADLTRAIDQRRGDR